MTHAETSARLPAGIGAALVVAVGVTVVTVLGGTVPDGRGPARLASPAVLLGVLDTIWLLAACAPGRATPAARVTVLLSGLPFHLASAAAAGAGPGHLQAIALLGAAYVGAASSVPSGRPAGALTLMFAIVGLPALGYIVSDLLGADGVALLLASPLTAPALLAHAPEEAALADVWPALPAAAGVIAAGRWAARHGADA
jgi:hypothetical protein